MPTPPLNEVQKMITKFINGKTGDTLDLKRISQLVEVAQQERIIMINKIKKA